MRADWTASGAYTSGSTARHAGATRLASGSAATTSTTRAERAAFQEMGGVGVPERIGIDVLADPGARLGAHEDPVDTAGGEGTAPGPAGKQDGVRPDRLRVRLQDGVQVRRERDVAVLAPFALLEPSTAVRAAAPSSP